MTNNKANLTKPVFTGANQVNFALRILFAAIIVGILLGILFNTFPELDFILIRPFYGGGDIFILAQLRATNIARDAFQLIFAGFCVTAFVGALFGRLKQVHLFGFSWLKWLYFLVCAALGPGLLANIIFKDNWGRARPNQVVELGGQAQFSPVLQISDQCSNNCSFVGGESSAIYMLFFALAFMTNSRRQLYLMLALILGTAAGTIRMGQGGHFASDIAFSGIFMAILASIVCIIFVKLFDHRSSYRQPNY